MFSIEPIKYIQWKIEIETLNKEKKWLMYIPQDKKIQFCSINICEENKIFPVGAGYFFKKDEMIDWSFFIYPKFQKRGIAHYFVRYLLTEITNLQFTVSKFNKPSMNLFRSIVELREESFNIKTNSYVFRSK